MMAGAVSTINGSAVRNGQATKLTRDTFFDTFLRVAEEEISFRTSKFGSAREALKGSDGSTDVEGKCQFKREQTHERDQKAKLLRNAVILKEFLEKNRKITSTTVTVGTIVIYRQDGERRLIFVVGLGDASEESVLIPFGVDTALEKKLGLPVDIVTAEGLLYKNALEGKVLRKGSVVTFGASGNEPVDFYILEVL